MSVESVPGKGTTASVFFPSASPEKTAQEGAGKLFCTDEEKTAVTIKPEGQKSDATLLVVDDEELVRKTICRILQHHGYKTLEAEAGEQAIEIFFSGKDSIDGVILDLTMPGISGREVLTRLRDIEETIPILLVSGGSMGELDHPFLPKPFTPEELLQSVKGFWRS